MFTSAGRRKEKNRLEEVFKLQFHATQVPQAGVDALTLSLVPADIRKPTLRLQKAIVRDGTCRWEDPAYETIRFIRKPKTGKIKERIYHFIVSSGLSKAGIIGEVTVDFADYAEATNPCTLSLPLNDLNPNTVLHVLICRLHGISNEIEEEETEDAKLKSQIRSLKSHFSIDDIDDIIKSSFTEDDPFNKTTNNNSPLDGNCISSSGSNVPLSRSETSSDLDTPCESCRKASDEYTRTRTQESCHQASTAETEKLKAELVVMARQADVTKLELQTLRKQIVKESVRAQDLSRQVMSLREERNVLEAERKRLEAFQERVDGANGDIFALVDEISQELSLEKDQTASLRIELQKAQESNAGLVITVQDLCKSGSHENTENGDAEQKALEELVKERMNDNDNDDEDQIVDLYSIIKIYKSDKDELEIRMEQLALDYELLKQENHDLSYTLEQTVVQEQLRMETLCSCSSNVTELEIQVENMKKEHEKQVKESAATVSELEARIKSLEDDMEKQAREFEAEIESLMRARLELEQRAIRAEKTLQTTRLKDANTAERIQVEFQRLSTQMASTLEANEKVAMKAVAEAGVLRMQKFQAQEMLRKANEELKGTKEEFEVKMLELSNILDFRTNQVEQMLLESGNKSKQLKLEEESNVTLSQQILTLKAEILEMKNSMEETELLVQRGNVEISELATTIASLKKEADKSAQELEHTRNLIKEKSIELEFLRSELQMLKCQCPCQCNDLTCSLLEDEVEEEKRQTRVFQSNDDDAFAIIEKKLEDHNEGLAVSVRTKTTPGNDKALPVPFNLEAMQGEGETGEITLSTELASLKERNKSIEIQLKEMQERYSEISELAEP